MNKRIKLASKILLVIAAFSFVVTNAFAQNAPSSNNYKVIDYGFGAGGTASSSSQNYSMFGTLGQVDQGSASSNLYSIGAGLEYEIMASAPAAPTFVNPNNYYNKLHLTIARGGNDPTDYQYAIRIASGSGQFQYVQNDNTVGNLLGNEDWQSYSSLGGSTGIDLVGLYPGTTYTVQVAARQSQFYTQSIWGPTATAATLNPTLSFDIDIAPADSESAPPYILNIGNLTPGSVTTSTDKVWVDIATNATNGGLISINGTNNGLLSSSSSHTISSSTVDLTAPTEGYGARSYSTAQSAGGPMEALSPYNSVTSTVVGVLDTTKRYMFDSSQTQVSGGRVAFELKAKAANTTPSAADYSDVLTILVTGSF